MTLLTSNFLLSLIIKFFFMTIISYCLAEFFLSTAKIALVVFAFLVAQISKILTFVKTIYFYACDTIGYWHVEFFLFRMRII